MDGECEIMADSVASSTNKCNNEKRRREQENIYIEELAELISANFADMSSLSVKPDKCAILQETVNQIRRIRQQDNANQQSVDPVQQGEVSSSRPTILSNEVYGPLLLEALEGFLFVINSDGKVEHVTENVGNYMKYTKDEIIGKSIYNFMHPGDHSKFHSNLLPMTIDWGSSDPPPPPTNKSKSIDVRLLIKAYDDLDETIEEKTQREPIYENMHISSTHLRGHLSISEDDGSDTGPCLLCVASRISHRDKITCFFEQFTTKLDLTGKITNVDTSGVSEPVAKLLRKDFQGRLLRDLVPPQDLQKVTAYLRDTLSSNSVSTISPLYRIQIGPDKLVQVQTKSKVFKTNPHANSDTDFIMATHSIISDSDAMDLGGAIGGPLMTSIVNGATSRNGPSSGSEPNPPSASSGTMIPATNTGGAFTQEYLQDEFPSLDFPTTTWELEPGWPETTRPNSRQSITPVSTPQPRPPSNPSYSNAPTIVQSPIAHYSAQPSPANQQQQNQNSNYMSFGMMEEYQDQNVYPVEEQKDSKANVMEEAASLAAEPQRLRILLEQPKDENRDRILKGLLNQQDDDQGGRMDNRNNARGGMMNRGQQMAEPPKMSASSSSSGNDMLRKLLNEKTDDDNIEAKAGMKNGSELLSQLLKESDDDDDKKNENGPHEDALLKTLGFPSGSPSDRRGSKRSMDDKDDRESKRSNNGSQVSSSGCPASTLCQKNKMLASLLANPAPTVPTIPPMPASVISATPHEKLPRVEPSKLIGGIMSQSNNFNSRIRVAGLRAPTYISNDFQRTLASVYANQATSTSDNHQYWGENNNINIPGLSDPDLSDLLDAVIDYVPDSGILQILEPTVDGQQHNSPQLSETAAIKNIQRSLMMIGGDALPSPNVSLPSRPPAYSANVSSQNNLSYPPPPNYPQVKYPRGMSIRAGNGPRYATTQQQMVHDQQRKIQQQHEKQRLLLAQSQQQLVIPSNVTADMNSIQSMDNLMNNTIAPNVTLQRSNSVPESQLSPNYTNSLQCSNSLTQTTQRTIVSQSNQQQPYSPHAQMPSPLGQQNFQTQTTATGNYNPQRLSPQAQYNAQLSPRQAYPTQGNGTGNSAAANWAAQQQRLTVQNPMLNAQLTGALTGRGNFQRPPAQQQSQQQQRALNSPGGVPGGARHSPFGGDQFAPPSSPNAAFNQNQYLRGLQRANSVPTSSSQMTGGMGSPRSYNNQAPPHYSPNPIQSIPPNSMLYSQAQQESPYNCYEQQAQTHQQSMGGYDRRGSAPAQHLQPGVVGSNPTSEFVRQELRAVVGARTAQGQGASGQRSGPSAAQQLQQQINQQGTVDLDSLGISFEMPPGASESPKLWGAMGSEMGSMSPQPATSRTTMEDGRPGDHAKTSLLQQLLSDQSK